MASSTSDTDQAEIYVKFCEAIRPWHEDYAPSFMGPDGWYVCQLGTPISGPHDTRAAAESEAAMFRQYGETPSGQPI
jgi:hypothetical protein